MIAELLQVSFPELLRVNQSKDISALRTTAGIHRDDLEFNLNEQPFKVIASQGQKKSLLFALKLAEIEILKKEKGFAPLLLLDDVFEKLDEERIANLFLPGLYGKRRTGVYYRYKQRKIKATPGSFGSIVPVGRLVRISSAG